MHWFPSSYEPPQDPGDALYDPDPTSYDDGPLSSEPEESMSSDPVGENLEIDDGMISEVVRKPTRTAGDLSESAGSSAEITTENVARDLESVASKARTSTDRELLEDLIRRMERIELFLGISSTDSDVE